MWEPLKIVYKSELETQADLTKIKEKLVKFLSENPEVDHYLDIRGKRQGLGTFLLGFLLGGAIIFLISISIIFCYLGYWHDMGWLNVPGLFD